MISVIITAFVSFASTNIDDIFVLMLFFSQVDAQLQKRHIIIGQYLGIMTLLFISILGSIGLNLIPQQYTRLLGIVPILLGIKEWLKYKKDKKDALNSKNEIVSELQSETIPTTVTDNLIIENLAINTINTENIVESEVQELSAEESYIIDGDVIANPHTEIKQTPATKKEKIKVALRKLIHPAVLNVFLVTIANGADNIGIYIPLFTRLNTLELITTIIIFLLLIAVWCFTGERLTNFPRIKHTIQKYKSIVVPVVFIVIGISILV